MHTNTIEKAKPTFNGFPKIESLQGLRAVAYICIFLHHSDLNGMDALGPFGVSIFIILSGFLMGGKYIGNNKKTNNAIVFTANKIKWLYILHVITTVVVVGYYFIITDFSEIPVLSWVYGFFVDIVMVWPYVGFIDSTLMHFNGPSWYMAICVLSYLVFPLILKLMRKYRSAKTANVVIAISALLLLAMSIFAKQLPTTELQKHFTYYFPLSRLPEFIIGCNMGYIYVSSKKKEFFKNKDLLFAIAVCLTLASWYIFDKGFLFLGQEYFRDTALFLVPSVLLIYSVPQCRFFNAPFVSKVAVNIGDLSPYAFLIHVPVNYYTKLILSSWDNDIIITVLLFIITLVLSQLFYKMVNALSKKNKDKSKELV